MYRRSFAFLLLFIGCSLGVLSFAKTLRSGASPAQPATPPAGQWEIVPSPDTTAQVLSAVACASASDCLAMGHFTANNGAWQPLIEHWNGSAWSIVSSPYVSDNHALLTGVSCSSATDCWASGHYIDNNSGLYTTLIEHWDGNAWSFVSSPNLGTHANKLFGLTCTSATDCWAVGSLQNTGSTKDQTLTLHWNGTSWSAVASPSTSASQSNLLLSVACVSSSSCFAVGYYGTINQTLVEQWNGASWSIVSSPNTSSSLSNSLQDVTCTSATNCWAVGYARSGASTYQTLIERWDGMAWTITASPNDSSADSSFLFGVTCTSTSQCWAVGYSSQGVVRHTLIAKWNGSTWTITNSPSGDFRDFFAVACSSSSQCWATGEQVDNTLIARWDNVSWSIVPSATASGGGYPNILRDGNDHRERDRDRSLQQHGAQNVHRYGQEKDGEKEVVGRSLRRDCAIR